MSELIFPILFADDTNAFVTGKNVNELVKTMNEELEKITEWLHANKLSLNVAKTHFIIFKSIGMAKPVFSEILKINKVPIKEDSQTKFLGVIVDSKLSWHPHIQYIKSKISKGIGIICKAKCNLNIETLRTLYYSFVYPYFNYAIEVWGDTCDSYMVSIVRLQKKAVRIIANAGRYEHSTPLFDKLKLMTIKEIHFYKIALTMYKVRQNTAPNVLTSLFTLNETVHSYNTRQSTSYHVPLSRTNYIKRTISSKGVRIWNTCCKKLSLDCSYLSFKKSLRNLVCGNITQLESS